jgi:hypothetical protein
MYNPYSGGKRARGDAGMMFWIDAGRGLFFAARYLCGMARKLLVAGQRRANGGRFRRQRRSDWM